MRIISPTLLALLWLVAFAAGCQTAVRPSEGFSWYKALDYPFFEARFGPGVLTVAREGDSITFDYLHRPPKADSMRVLSASVVVATAGSLLQKSEYEDALARSSAETRARDFPSLGARARILPLYFGPQGSIHGVVLTTDDEHYDVQISVSDTGTSLGVSPPHPTEVGRDLLGIYRTQTQE